MKTYFCSVFCILILSWFVPDVKGQEISGVWEGNFANGILMEHPRRLTVKLTVRNDTIISGTTHLQYDNDKYEHYKISGVFREKDSTVFFTEEQVISVKLGLSFNCLGNYRMKLSIDRDTMRLTGEWKDNKSRFIFTCPTTEVWLSKPLVINAGQSPKKDLDNKLRRWKDVQQVIELRSDEKDSIKIEIRDNAEIDNDKVSVFLNDSLLLEKATIASAPIVRYINLPDSAKFADIAMVAESLGSIPPCTATMKITTRRKSYSFSLNSDYTKNGVVRFFTP
jgi:hypothetical protein